MKRLLSAVLCAVLTLSVVSGCSTKKDKGRILYNVKLNKLVELGDYKKLTVDTSDDDYDKAYKDIISADVSNNDLYVKKTTGVVANGDTVNIDYTGKKDGVAFQGGTDTGYDLLIGSGSFIEGFEAGLIGVNVGDTVDLPLTFPENYGNVDLAGQAVVFTVKVNSVKTQEERKPEDYYKDLGFDTLDDYIKDANERAAKNYLVNKVVDDSKINEYPQEDIDTIYSVAKDSVSSRISQSYGITFDSYLSATSQTESDYKKNLYDQSIQPLMENQLVLYAIFDKEKMKMDENAIDDKIKDTLASINDIGVTKDMLLKAYGEYYFEYLVVSDKVVEFLYDEATIK